MEKCKWHWGKFIPCSDGEEYFNDGSNCFNLHDNDYIGITYCPFCGARIIEAEDKREYTIKPSGDTFVTKKDGVDYFCIVPPSHGLPEFPYTIETHWRRIDEVVITQNIAKMWPMVVFTDGGDKYMRSLVYVSGNVIITAGTIPFSCVVPFGEFRLATVDDLED